MKIKFIDGVAGHRGAMVTEWEGKMVAGYFTKFRYSNNDKVIGVVKQRSIWFTILIFIHEIAHYLTGILFKGKKQDRINVWIDEYIIRPKDKK